MRRRRQGEGRRLKRRRSKRAKRRDQRRERSLIQYRTPLHFVARCAEPMLDEFAKHSMETLIKALAPKCLNATVCLSLSLPLPFTPLPYLPLPLTSHSLCISPFFPLFFFSHFSLSTLVSSPLSSHFSLISRMNMDKPHYIFA